MHDNTDAFAYRYRPGTPCALANTGPMHRVAARSGRTFEVVVWVVAAIAACYLLVGAYYGYQVGRAMHEAKASNPMLAMVAGAVGRNASEQFVIRRFNVPQYIVRAPTFWVALRMNE